MKEEFDCLDTQVRLLEVRVRTSIGRFFEGSYFRKTEIYFGKQKRDLHVSGESFRK